MKKMKKIIKIAGKVISLVSILFIIRSIWRLGFDFSSIKDWKVFTIVILAGVLIKMMTVFVMGDAWTGWLRLLGNQTVDRRAAMCAYVKANIGKYLPGNVMHYVERNLFAANLGISQKKMAASSVIEVIGLVGISLLIAVVFSFDYLIGLLSRILGDYMKLLPAAICVCVCIGLLVLFILRKKLHEFVKECGIGRFVETFLAAVVKYAVVLVGLGVIMVLLFGYMGGELNARNTMLIISGYIIAWVLGFIIPGASGGIGVRELAITTLLGAVVGQELILTLSVVHRLITIIGDFACYFIGILMKREKEI
jgi:hypothetical protein